MSDCILTPAVLSGNILPPPSKSYVHRACIAAALSCGVSRISNIAMSQDIEATISVLRQIGAEIKIEDNTFIIKGIFADNKVINKNIFADCNESGSTLRFLIPIVLALGAESIFTGRGKLPSRPLDTYFNIFKKQNIFFKNEGDGLNLNIKGRLLSDTFVIQGDISSQFITGLLFALPLLENDSKIIIEGKLESRGYVDLSLEVLEKFGIKVQNDSYKSFFIKGNQQYKPCDYSVETDWSQAAFFLSASALGHNVYVKGLNMNSLQADREIALIFKNLGIDIIETNQGITAIKRCDMSSEIDASSCPDIIPIVALVAALADGKKTLIKNAVRLRIKECDRLFATVNELNKLGAKLTEGSDFIIINGVKSLKGGTKALSHNDHRIAMMISIAASICQEPVSLVDYECVKKSYPNFFKDYTTLGGKKDEFILG